LFYPGSHIDILLYLIKKIIISTMVFKVITCIESKSGIIYKVNQNNIVISISKDGTVHELKPNKFNRVKIAGKQFAIYNLKKNAGFPPIEWPEDYFSRDWEELTGIKFKTSLGLRYRILEDSEVQSMDQYGKIKTLKGVKNLNGYITCGDDWKVHQLMGMIDRWVPKPFWFDETWTVDHLDNDPTNNHWYNLRWKCPKGQAKNRRHAEQLKIYSYPVIGTALQDIILINGEIIMKGECDHYDNANIAGKMIGGGNSGISQCICNPFRNKSYKGCMWKTPLSNPDIMGEFFLSIGSGLQSERFVSTFGRIKYVFHHNYTQVFTAQEKMTSRQQREQDTYPDINISGKSIKFHRKVVELFVGVIPKETFFKGQLEQIIIDHIDNNKTNARLGNLQILTRSENNLKMIIQSYIPSVASFINKKYEKSHNSRTDAIRYVQQNGYQNATVEELDAALKLTTFDNIPAVVYGRTWIHAHFESYKIDKLHSNGNNNKEI
jgi:hypothetical protein